MGKTKAHTAAIMPGQATQSICIDIRTIADDLRFDAKTLYASLRFPKPQTEESGIIDRMNEHALALEMLDACHRQETGRPFPVFTAKISPLERKD